MTKNEHARLLEEYLERLCDDDPEAHRSSYRDWFLKHNGTSLAVGTMLAFVGCGDGSRNPSDQVGSGGEESSIGGDMHGVSGHSTTVAGDGQGGKAAAVGGTNAHGGLAGSGHGGTSADGGVSGSGHGGASVQGGTSGNGWGGAEVDGGSAGANQGGALAGGTAGEGTAGTVDFGGSSGSSAGGSGPGGQGGGIGGTLVQQLGGSGPAYGIPLETNCGDGEDNDFDGATDCADLDCFDFMSCSADYAVPLEICDDKIDNDSDGATDCGDFNCFGDPACTGDGGAGGGGAGGAGGEGGGATDLFYVTLSLPQESATGCYAGMSAHATFHNDSRSDVYLPGCANYYVDHYGTRTPDAVCSTEGISRTVPAGGTFEVAYPCPDVATEVALCLEVSFGCTPNLPLSAANCSGAEWYCSPSFRIYPLP